MKKRSTWKIILIGVGVLTLLCVVAVGAGAWFLNRLENEQITYREQLTERIAAGDRDMALVSYAIMPDGSPNPNQPQLFYNAEEPFPLASTIKIVLLAAYAQAVVDGELDPEQSVTLAEWDSYYLPGTDGGAHAAALAGLDIDTDDLGFAEDGQQSVTLDVVVGSMIAQSDNAATDYVRALLGEERIQAIIEAAELEGQMLPIPISGFFLAGDNVTLSGDPTVRAAAFENLSAEEIQALALEWEQRYREDPAFREQQIAVLAEASAEEPDEAELAAIVAEQALLVRRFPTGTAVDYARIMAGVASETFLSSEVSRIMQQHLEWPLEQEINALVFETYGVKGGALPGILTEAAYIQPLESPDGAPRVVIFFQKNMSTEGWLSGLESFVHQQFMVTLTQQPSLLEPFIDAQSSAR